MLTKEEIGQVINIKPKKAINQGWFGKAYVCGGTDNRREAGVIVNLFRDTTQISFLAYSNNVNKPGFNLPTFSALVGSAETGSALIQRAAMAA